MKWLTPPSWKPDPKDKNTNSFEKQITRIQKQQKAT